MWSKVLFKFIFLSSLHKIRFPWSSCYFWTALFFNLFSKCRINVSTIFIMCVVKWLFSTSETCNYFLNQNSISLLCCEVENEDKPCVWAYICYNSCAENRSWLRNIFRFLWYDESLKISDCYFCMILFFYHGIIEKSRSLTAQIPHQYTKMTRLFLSHQNNTSWSLI